MSAKQTKKTKAKKARMPKPKVAKRPKKEIRAKEAVESKTEEKVVERKEAVQTPAPTGTPPNAFVNVRHAGSMMEREAKGYSRGELSESGIGWASAKRWEVPVDKRRGSTLRSNVERLESWLRAGGMGRATSVSKAGPGKKK